MRFFKRYRLYVCASLLLAGIGLFSNSCKKDNSDTLSYFLTTGTWQLASVTRQTFVGDTLKTIGTDTLNLTCNLTQTFKFNTDNSCTYINYHCINQSSKGTWALDIDNLNVQTTLSAQDTSKNTIVTVKAFDNAQIETLGQYSLVLRTGYTSSYYTSKTKRVIVRYGFVHAVNQ
ncbi:MAG: hypothetical protein ABIN91_20345 [Mucilaginibacter sp.]|uniref:hypothetical protein n=1 Tax=Mucilaginibacter sp. TaxID=1882438 RepID=UPI0032653508